MPRRPRPTARRAPKYAAGASYDTQPATKKHIPAKNSAVTRPQGRPVEPDTTSEDESEASDQGDEDEDGESVYSEEEELDLDAPRVAQYVDEEELNAEVSGGSESESNEQEEGPSNLVRMFFSRRSFF
jgi:ribosomal RNA-processing protein 36